MFPTPFMEAPLKGVADDTKDDNDCLFDAEDSYSEWGLLTPPWSPCDSSAMDTCTECPVSPTDAQSAVATPTTRARCDSFLCSCTSCECSGLEQADGPVLRDCMWSQTTGLLPPPSLVTRHTSDVAADAADQKPGGGDCRPCCPAITAVCTNHTDRCVDPRNVFPCHPAATRSLCAQSQTVLQTLLTPDCSVTKSPVYDPDSETSAYCSSFSDDEMEEVDVVSVTSCGWNGEVQVVDPPPVRRQVLILPAAESMSAQVAAMHNYSNPRCRPLSVCRPVVSMSSSCPTKCVGTRAAGRPKRCARRVTTSSAVSSPASASDSSDSGVHDDERYKRAQHNVMERQRRYHLKSHFYGLRDVVPGTRGDGRVSKVAILRRAVDHIRHLAAVNEMLQAEHSHQRALQERWKWKLSLVNREARQGAVCSA